MRYPTICYMCGKTWQPKDWKEFFSFCGTCSKSMLESFENQMKKRVLMFNPPRKS